MTDKRDDGGAAFPGTGYGRGMSLRDWFAGQAITGVMAAELPAKTNISGAIKDAAEIAYSIADAMLAERKKGGEG